MSAAQFTKFYILHLLHKRGSMISEHFKDEFKKLTGNWKPAPSTLLDTLHDMTDDGLLFRTEGYKSEIKRRQKVYWYRVTEKGSQEFQVLKKKYKILFEEQIRILNKIIKEVYK